MHFADFVAGSVGGALGVAVGYPLDTVKVRIQTQQKFTGVWHCFRSTCKTEGVYGFFKGMSVPLTTVSITSSVVFGTYRNCLQCLLQLHSGSPEAMPTKLDIFLSGLAGGVTQVLVMSPMDTVKVRLQCQMEPRQLSANQTLPKYRGPIHCMLTIGQEEGVLSLYRGAPALALRDGPSFATYFLTYSTLCEWLTPADQKQPAWPVVMLAGGLAGIFGWTVGTPMDVIKARLQVDGMGKRRYNGFLHCIAESVRQEGPGVFFKGLGLNCMRAFPVNMVVFITYEQVASLLRTLP
ncbi:solute carrier family 25 member 47-B-like isoform X3 [Anguilla rostrata]|uniref:solute carrier family 25 member 47-B-like isoform X3 n=1 Tax=Anguilla rostrata TaxID=7938 RepID=UPI0030CD6C69